jgi:hypothetical protein
MPELHHVPLQSNPNDESTHESNSTSTLTEASGSDAGIDFGHAGRVLGDRRVFR